MNDKLYAELIVNKALNIKDGSILRIKANTENLPFAREVAKMAYEKGAAEVKVNIRDEALERLNMEHMSEERLEHFGEYNLDEAVDYAEDGCFYLSITGGDPDLFKGIDPKRIAKRSKAVGKVMKPSMKYTMNDMNSWCVVGYPTVKWAKKVFPDLSDEEAVEKLKEAIFKTVRLDREDPMAAWDEHLEKLESRGKKLNELQLDRLHYKTAKGTDLTIGLPEGHVWMGAVSEDDRKNIFLPNLPTEEIFTAPDKNRIDGVVYSTKPLNLSGTIVDEFKVVFEKGKAVEVSAKHGEQNLKDLIKTDEGSSSLGEVALVSVESPINRSGLFFMNTLFDENASCHLAFGAAYPTCLKGGDKMTEEELEKHGINDSQEHVDFMVGDETLEIVGYDKEGKEYKIFENGDFVI